MFSTFFVIGVIRFPWERFFQRFLEDRIRLQFRAVDSEISDIFSYRDGTEKKQDLSMILCDLLGNLLFVFQKQTSDREIGGSNFFLLIPCVSRERDL